MALVEDGMQYKAAFIGLVDLVGQAIHNAKKVGGPWGARCGYPVKNAWGEMDWVYIEYNDNSSEDYACECRAMAHHLLEELIKL